MIHMTFLFLLGMESEVAQLCPTLCDPMDCSLQGSSIHGIFQARVLEWVAISLNWDQFYLHLENQLYQYNYLHRYLLKTLFATPLFNVLNPHQSRFYSHYSYKNALDKDVSTFLFSKYKYRSLSVLILLDPSYSWSLPCLWSTNGFLTGFLLPHLLTFYFSWFLLNSLTCPRVQPLGHFPCLFIIIPLGETCKPSLMAKWCLNTGPFLILSLAHISSLENSNFIHPTTYVTPWHLWY